LPEKKITAVHGPLQLGTVLYKPRQLSFRPAVLILVLADSFPNHDGRGMLIPPQTPRMAVAIRFIHGRLQPSLFPIR
jgi:hypothetical protein